MQTIRKIKTSKNGPNAVFTHKISAKPWCKNPVSLIFPLYSVYTLRLCTLRLCLTPALYRLLKMYFNNINIYHYSNTLPIFLSFYLSSFLSFSRLGLAWPFFLHVIDHGIIFAKPRPDYFYQKIFHPLLIKQMVWSLPNSHFRKNNMVLRFLIQKKKSIKKDNKNLRFTCFSLIFGCTSCWLPFLHILRFSI